MLVTRWPAGEGPEPGRSAATLGVFDGVHRGHAEVIGRVVSAAREAACRAVVVTFDRHPAVVLSHAPQPSITSLDHRLRLFETLGADLTVVVEFSEEVAATSAEEFARRVFHDLLAVAVLVLGEDCRFGLGGQGDVSLCRGLGSELGWEVRTVPDVRVDGARISSTAIRQAILDGRFDRAAELLGRAFSLYGTVVPGDDRGRRLGYPTANLDLHNETIPPDGVYAAWVLTNCKPLPGVVSVGRRATFHAEGDAERIVEVHLLEGGRDLYGRDMEVQFVERLRGQIVFGSARELIAQIARDADQARATLDRLS